MRCLSLAKRLESRGAHVHFLCADLDGNLSSYLSNLGFDVTLLRAEDAFRWKESRSAVAAKGRADLLVVDHYKLGSAWETAMRDVATRIMVIDDLADRDHDCDYLLDQNPHEDNAARYEGRVPKDCKLFLGPRYAFIREEFERPELQRSRSGHLKRLFVCFGGSDPTNETIGVARSLASIAKESIFADMKVDIVVGSAFPNFDALERATLDLSQISLHRQSNDIASLLSQCDLSIGSCGTMSWERCALGVPSIVVTTADNQIETAISLEKSGAILWLGSAGQVDDEQIGHGLRRLAGEPESIVAMGRRAFEITKGRRAATQELVSMLMNQ
jgi:UDP-2,4-diacetamido-2,4,6-trideoxy-beta-L-altropyranose hydrolase